MRHPQLLVYERRRGLSELMRELARQRKWAFRLRRQPASCLRLLRRGNPSVLVLHIAAGLTDKSLRREFRLLERVAWLFPDTRTVVVSDREDAALVALAWELGAGYVLFGAEAPSRLSEVVAGLMKAAVLAP